jgi:membrane fusion protein, heavy metal efflux system
MNKPLFVLVAVLASTSTFAAGLQLTPAQLANVELTTATVSDRESLTHLTLNAVLTTDRRKTYRVAPVVDGLVTNLEVVAHERVRKGQVLAQLRSHSLGRAQAEYLEALARFDLVEAQRIRIKDLWEDGAVAESRWLMVDSEYKSAHATLEARRRLLSLAGLSAARIARLAIRPDRLAVFDLTSPIDGMVMEVAIESGQLLSVGQLAFRVCDLSTLWAMVRIPVASLAQVAVGDAAEIRVEASRGRSYRGKLESIGGEVDMQSQTLTGRIVLANPEERLRPGMYAEVSLSGVVSQSPMVPAAAVFRVGDQNYVFKVLGNGLFEPVAVDTGVEADGWVPIVSGVGVDAVVVSGGVPELKSHWQYQGGE